MRLLILTLAIAASIFARAQKNFQPGYVILNDGTRADGFINYKEWNHNPAEITFASSLNTEEQKFTVHNIRYFEVTGKEAYERFAARISMDSWAVMSMTLERDTSYKEDVVFMRVITKGRHVNLFSYTDPVKTRFYIQPKNDSAIVELGYKKYVSQDAIVEEKTYQSQLEGLLIETGSKTGKLTSRIKAATYTKKSLSRIIHEINGNDPKMNAIEAPAEKLPLFRFFAGAGVVNTTVKVPSSRHHLSGSQKDNSSLAPRVSAGADMFIFRHTGKLFFRLEAGYNFETGATLRGRRQNAYDGTYQIAMSTVFVTPQFLVNFYNAGRLKLFAGGGVSLYFTNFSKNHYEEYSSAGIAGIVTDEYFELKENKPYLTNMLRAGAVINRNIELSLLYQLPTGLSNGINQTVKSSFVGLHANFLFNKK